MSDCPIRTLRRELFETRSELAVQLIEQPLGVLASRRCHIADQRDPTGIWMTDPTVGSGEACERPHRIGLRIKGRRRSASNGLFDESRERGRALDS